jgi:drug/metabolite transporter (DMT)-like permease
MDRVEERTLPQLTRDLAVQLSDLFRQEIKLARVETVDAAKGLGAGVAFCGAALVVAIAATVTFSAFVVIALSALMPEWAAALLTALVMAGVAGALANVGLGRLKSEKLALPRTSAQLKNDINLIKEQTNS